MPNQILASLPETELELLQPQLEPATLRDREVLQDRDGPVSNLYFIESGLVSVLTIMENGSSVESALSGSEGVAGLGAFLGVDESPTRSIVQMPGEALRLERGALNDLLPQVPTLESALVRYTHLRLSMAYQLAACNRLHTVTQRCAFWLLQVHDRTDGDEFRLTHQFIAIMLGVRRASVTEAARRLLRQNLVEYRRGHVRIIDRLGLERQACECDAKLRQQRLSFLTALFRT